MTERDESRDAEVTHVKTNKIREEHWEDPVHGRLSWRTVFSADRTPTESVVCGIAAFQPGDVLKDHHHAPAEIIYVLAGKGKATVDGVEYPLEPGDAVFVPSHKVHSWEAGDEGLRFLYVLDKADFSDIEYEFVGNGGTWRDGSA